MQNRRRLMHIDQENDLKPHFGPFLALNGPILGPANIFSAPCAQLSTRYHNYLAFYAKSPKTNAYQPRK